MAGIEKGFCQCGCGQTPAPRRLFVRGHNSKPPRPLCACGCGVLVLRRRSRYRHGHNRRTATLEQRLHAYIDKTASCWLWTGAINDAGYGVLGNRKGERRAHRLMWEFARGPIPADMFVLHRCDTPRCVRPDHLFLGDAAANAIDKVSKGRQCRGETSPHTRLTEAQALEIRASARDTATRRRLAQSFGVRLGTIYGIQNGTTWKHLQEASASI